MWQRYGRQAGVILVSGEALDDVRVEKVAKGLERCVEILSNKKLLGAPGLTTRSKDATRGSWPY